jgi:hypothetical protein
VSIAGKNCILCQEHKSKSSFAWVVLGDAIRVVWNEQ